MCDRPYDYISFHDRTHVHSDSTKEQIERACMVRKATHNVEKRLGRQLVINGNDLELADREFNKVLQEAK